MTTSLDFREISVVVRCDCGRSVSFLDCGTTVQTCECGRKIVVGVYATKIDDEGKAVDLC